MTTDFRGIVCIIDRRLRDEPPERYHDITWGVVVDEIVQLRPLIKIIRHFVFHGGAVDGDHATVLKPQLHTASRCV